MELINNNAPIGVLIQVWRTYGSKGINKTTS